MASPHSSALRPSDAEGADAPSAEQVPARLECEIIAVTTSDEFLLELGEALGGQAAVRPVESVADALEHVRNSRRTQLIAFDVRAAADARGELERARVHAPHVPVLAFADDAATESNRVNLQGSEVFALLPLPVDRRKTSAALEGAISAAAKRAPAGGSSPGRTAAEITVSHHEIATQDPATPGRMPVAADLLRRLPVPWIGAGVGAALLIGGAIWFLVRGGSEAEQAAAVTVPRERAAAPREERSRPPVILQGSLDELLEKARLAMRERRFTEPADDNALVYFRSALATDASNAEARDGLLRIGTVLLARVEEAIAQNRFEEAWTALAVARNATPEDRRLGALETRLTQRQLERAVETGDFERAAAVLRTAQKSSAIPEATVALWKSDLARRQEAARVRRATQLATERLREGRLVEPAGDSAKHYIQQLQALGAAASATQRLSRELGNAYLRKARESASAGRLPEAERWLDEARAAGVAATDIAAVQRDAAAAREKAAAAEIDRLAQLARERLKDGKLIEPAGDSAAHYLTALQSAEEGHDAIAGLRRDLAKRLLERAEQAVRAGGTARVEADLTAARRFGADTKEIQALQQPVASPRSEAPRADVANLQKLAKRTRYVAPEYPPKALERGVSGRVTVVFVIDVAGQPRDPQVTQGEPAGVFDRAALTAIKRWRYEPVVVDGVPVEIPMRAVMKFELPKE